MGVDSSTNKIKKLTRKDGLFYFDSRLREMNQRPVRARGGGRQANSTCVLFAARNGIRMQANARPARPIPPPPPITSPAQSGEVHKARVTAGFFFVYRLIPSGRQRQNLCNCSSPCGTGARRGCPAATFHGAMRVAAGAALQNARWNFAKLSGLHK